MLRWVALLNLIKINPTWASKGLVWFFCSAFMLQLSIVKAASSCPLECHGLGFGGALWQLEHSCTMIHTMHEFQFHGMEDQSVSVIGDE